MEALWNDCPFTDVELVTAMEVVEEDFTRQRMQEYLAYEDRKNAIIKYGTRSEEYDVTIEDVISIIGCESHQPLLIRRSLAELQSTILWRRDWTYNMFYGQPTDPADWKWMWECQDELAMYGPVEEELWECIMFEQNYMQECIVYYYKTYGPYWY